MACNCMCERFVTRYGTPWHVMTRCSMLWRASACRCLSTYSRPQESGCSVLGWRGGQRVWSRLVSCAQSRPVLLALLVAWFVPAWDPSTRAAMSLLRLAPGAVELGCHVALRPPPCCLLRGALASDEVGPRDALASRCHGVFLLPRPGGTTASTWCAWCLCLRLAGVYGSGV